MMAGDEASNNLKSVIGVKEVTDFSMHCSSDRAGKEQNIFGMNSVVAIFPINKPLL